MKDGKAWGCTYDDGRSTSYGWMDPESAPIRDPKCCTKATDLTYAGSPYISELAKAELVIVERTTTVTILRNSKAQP